MELQDVYDARDSSVADTVNPLGRESGRDSTPVTPEKDSLPAGWRELIDEASGESYYQNAAGETTWDRPRDGVRRSLNFVTPPRAQNHRG